MGRRIRRCRRQDGITNEEIQKESIIHHLPKDVLCKIFSYLDDIDHLESTSLVCKLFYSISSPLVNELTIKNPSLTCSHYQRLFKRFPEVKKICFDFPKLDNALMAISNSGLNLEKLQLPEGRNVKYPKPQTIENMSTSRVITGIKYLQLNRFYGCSKHLVIKFVNVFPSLTEVIFTNGIRWNDEQIGELTSKHPNLRKIDLSNNDDVTDMTLAILSSNCPKLETVNFRDCECTSEALYKFFCNNPQLSSVGMPRFYSPSISMVSKLVEGMQVLKNLNYLSLKYGIVQDAFLTGLAESRPPLKRLKIRYDMSKMYTMTGLSKFLSVCPGLESLIIQLPNSENCNTHDAEMSMVVKGLPCLKKIKLSSHRVVFQATLFSLVHNCPLLEKILLMRYEDPNAKQVYCDPDMAIPSKKNYSIKSIAIISPNNSDLWLRSTVESFCPKLRKQNYFMD